MDFHRLLIGEISDSTHSFCACFHVSHVIGVINIREYANVRLNEHSVEYAIITKICKLTMGLYALSMGQDHYCLKKLY